MSAAAPKMKMNKTLITKAVLTVLIILIAGYSQYKQEAENQESTQQSTIAALGAKLKSLKYSGKPLGDTLKSLKYSGKPLGEMLKSLKYSGKPLGRIIGSDEQPLPKWILVIGAVMGLSVVFRKQIEKAMESSK